MRKRSSKISFWVSDSERKRIKNLAKKTGMGEGEYLRLSALGKTIFQIEELKPMLHDLKGVSRNLNQLTMLAHEGRVTVINLAPVLSWLERNYDVINGLFEENVIASGGKNNSEIGNEFEKYSEENDRRKEVDANGNL